MTPVVDQAVLEAIALTREEYDLIVARLGRVPNELELGMFAALWSEHCGYKNSKLLLRLLPTEAPHVLQGPGENAGAIDIGDGLAVVLKMESHNHPSAVEPVQGAATGVGGIIRDIFTMGARPIALLDALRFGPLDDPHCRYLFAGVVHGISFYGNCIGVPTVGGEVRVAPCYRHNPLVNVMAVGIAPRDRLVRARASGVGNRLLLVGADTGRDGIHGCSALASRELASDRADQRPTVQVGNPFLEKLLIEACLEALQSDAVVGMQDLGAAGITSAVVECASKSGTGVWIDVQRVSRRETGMTPYEVMLSESQERMLVVVKRGREAEVQAIFQRWGLHSDVIGEVTDDGLIRVLDGGTVVAEVPAALLTSPPLYRRQGQPPPDLEARVRFDWRTLPPPTDYTAVLRRLLAHPDIASKEPVYRQYDYSVQTNTLIGPGQGDAAVLRLKGTRKALALTAGCNSRYCYLDPYRGAQIAVAEAARNIVCSGGRPLAVTDCLNFGNPEKPSIYYQLEQAVRGLADACRALAIPVVSGNVSLYNETDGQAVYPTPMVGMVGVLEEAAHRRGLAFQRPGDLVVLIGGSGAPTLGASTYLEALHGLVAGAVPALDLAYERRVQEFCLAAIQADLLRSAHDVSDGGLAVALAECCIVGALGAEIDLPPVERPDAWLFGEDQSWIVASLRPEDWPRLQVLAERQAVPVVVVGRVGGDRLRIGALIDAPVAELASVWRHALEMAQETYGRRE